MQIGHINLARSFNGTGEHFISLVEGLQREGISQYVLVRNVTMAKRLATVRDVTVGPVVRSAVTACCLMPRLDLVHIHDMSAAQAGLLLVLTRSIPYVLSYSGDEVIGRNPITQAVYRRATKVICGDDSEASILRHFDPSLPIEIVPAMEIEGPADSYLHLYQNSQSTPMAGSSGIQ